MFMRNALAAHFGNDFPVSSGSTTQDDPLIITEQRDYVSIEYVVAKHLLSELGLDYKFNKQNCRTIDGRVIDELEFVVRKPSEPDRSQVMSFYFDITLGFNRRDAPSHSHPPINQSKQTLQEPKVSDFSQQEFESLVAAIIQKIPNNREGVELRNWIKLKKLILTYNPNRIGLPNSGKRWEVLSDDDGTFKSVALYLKGLEPKDGVKTLISEVLPAIRSRLGSPEQFLRRDSPVQNAQSPGAADPDVAQSLDSFFQLTAMQIVKGNDPLLSFSAVYQALTGLQDSMSWFISRPSLSEMCEQLVTVSHERGMTAAEHELASQLAKHHGIYQDSTGKISTRTPSRKAWWKFWQ